MRNRYAHLPIVLSGDSTGEGDGITIPFSDVKRLLVRENTGRREDDDAMAQLYAVLKDTDLPILLHQHYLVRKKTVLEMGARVALMLDVQLDDEL